MTITIIPTPRRAYSRHVIIYYPNSIFIINSYQVIHTNEASEPTAPPLDEEHFEGDTDEAAESVAAPPKLPEVCLEDMHVSVTV